MEKTWRDYLYLHSNHGGARDAFERDCQRLLSNMYPGRPVHVVKASQGDGGIDVFIGDYGISPLAVYQCKFFIDSFGDSQKTQIRESFTRASESEDFKMSKWVLCMPLDDFTQKQHKWWSAWKTEQERETGITIEILNGNALLLLLKKHELYEIVFNVKDSLLIENIHNNIGLLIEKSITSDKLANLQISDSFEIVFDKAEFRTCFTPQYRLNYEKFYINRRADEDFIAYLFSPKNIWVYGASGLGKTCMCNRNLLIHNSNYFYCYLTALPNPNQSDEILHFIYDSIESKYEERLSLFVRGGKSVIKDIASILYFLFPDDETIVYIDEVQISSDAVFVKFANDIAAICAEYNERQDLIGNIKFVISTIKNPNDFYYNKSKVNEIFYFVNVIDWSKQEVELLIDKISQIGNILTANQKVALAEYCNSPRIVKEIAHQFALNHKRQKFEQVVEDVLKRN